MTCGEDGVAQVCNLNLDIRDKDDMRVLEWEIRSGTELGPSGAYRVLSYDEWIEKQGRYRAGSGVQSFRPGLP